MIIDVFAIWITQPGPALFWTMLGSIGGATVNHYAAKMRDQDKEFNALADAVRNQLRRERGDVRYGFVKADSDSLNTLVDMSSPLRRRRLRGAIEDYKKAREQHIAIEDTYGQRSYARIDHIERAIDTLLKRLKRR